MGASDQTRRRSSRPSRLTNAVAATAFLIGGTLFAVGAALAQAGASSTICATVYLVGGVFFSTGGYASVLQIANEPSDDWDAGQSDAPWRWWSHEPRRLQWLSAVILFAGTLVFAINLADSFIEGLGATAEDRLVWSPDMVGCALFLVSGHLALVAIAGLMQEFEHPLGPRRRRGQRGQAAAGSRSCARVR